MKMRNAVISIVSLAPVLIACGSNTAPTTTAPRITETISTTANVQANGIVAYPNGFPTIVVHERGQVDAMVTFNPTADCQFIFTICSATIASACGTPSMELESPRGAGPSLAASGVLLPDSYYLLLSARLGGVSLCSTVSAGGTALAYTITVTHP